ncbi:Isopenicillin N epimerase component 2 [Cyphellophora attinorum]|uniref:Isopenicillin N epimerase component 2 n=1 Tax=Cyphellophora attinorum TaxID=1664694 RepID=A0A0N1H5Q7_9EURO|nr:Isopenicillin N epimerase component 2 [Phialophora attinorum]KPI36433.1 Isopenicillin N epimerase component 2 [Phialophora attinorum]
MTSGPPLAGLKVVELGGLAPGPFCGQLLASYGASVLRIDRPGAVSGDLLTQFKSSIALDLKSPSSHALLLDLLKDADVLIDPFRPGVLEKLGLGPSTLHSHNPRLIITRLTGFRRDGKYKDMAGHDINYLAVSGILSLLGARNTPPLAPGNILADFAGGGHVAFTGVLLALLHRGTTGKGQIVEANMVDGVNYLGSYPRMLKKTPMWSAPKGENTLDGGAPYYGTYECKDAGKYMSVGALEPQFFAVLLKGLGLTIEDVCPNGLDRTDKRTWAYQREVYLKRFKTKTRKEWEGIFDETDACCAPVLELEEMEEAGYDLRPIVGLTESPGQPSVYDGKTLKPGEGGEKTLKDWLGWSKGKEFEIDGKGVWSRKKESRL